VFVAGLKDSISMQLEVSVQENLTTLDVVDVSAHLVHAVGRDYAYHVVATGFAEDAVGQVDGLVAAVAQKDVLGRNTFYALQEFLDITLQWVGIAVVGGIIRILVSIEEYVSLFARVFVTGTAIRSQTPYILSN
jgi:hypothetical protein